MDLVDQAQALEEQRREDALATLRRRAAVPREAADHCASCGDPIPLARRKALPGTHLCAFCARQVERDR